MLRRNDAFRRERVILGHTRRQDVRKKGRKGAGPERTRAARRDGAFNRIAELPGQVPARRA